MKLEKFKTKFRPPKQDDFVARLKEVEDVLEELSEKITELKDEEGNARRFEKVHDSAAEELEEYGKIDQNAKSTERRKAFLALPALKKLLNSNIAYVEAELENLKYAGITKQPVQGIDHDVHLHIKSMPGFEEAEPEKQQEVAAAVLEKVKKGKEKLDEVRGLSETELEDYLEENPPDRSDIADMMWFIRVMAEEKAGDNFRKGAITIPDENGNMRKYIDKCEEIYGRGSSHLKEEQKKGGKVKDPDPSELGGHARGIDYYDGNLDNTDTLLPYGMNTLLTQTVRDKKGKTRLFIKTETEGARVNPLYRKQKDTPKARDWHMKDVKNSLVHFKNLLSPDHDKSQAAFREQTPKVIAKSFRTAMAVAKKNKDKEVAAELGKAWKQARKPFGTKDNENSVRVQGIVSAFERVSDMAMSDATAGAINHCKDEILNAFSGQGDIGKRFGGEVVLTDGDLSGTQQPDDAEDTRNEKMRRLLGLDDTDEEEENTDESETEEEDNSPKSVALNALLIAATEDRSSLAIALREHGEDAGLNDWQLDSICRALESWDIEQDEEDSDWLEEAVRATRKVKDPDLRQAIFEWLE